MISERFSLSAIKCILYHFSQVIETRVMGLSSSEDPMIVAYIVLAWYQRVTDGQTDRFTIANTALSIAIYADAL